MIKGEWFKIKKYPHIGTQINSFDYLQIKQYISKKENIEKHPFGPFIHRVKKQRKFRKEYDKCGNVKNSGKRKADVKERELFYASHIDAMIYSYYSHLLIKKYNKLLINNDIDDVVTAYRKIPINRNNKKSKGKSNINFANEIFNYIKVNSKRTKEQVVIAFDITGFFDNLNHKKLKEMWLKVLRLETLPKDHYQVFKNITKFSYVDEKKLFDEFKDKILVERFIENKKNSIRIKEKKIDKIKYFKNKRVVSFCNSKNDLYNIRKKGLIKSNKYNLNGTKREKGIPQGSPISATLANIYMFDFDILMHTELKNLNGIYRRYSDDMIIVCDLKHKQQVVDLFVKEIDNICDLEIKEAKTQIFRFIKENNSLVCYQEFGNILNGNKNLEYLGFQFNGEHIYLKNSSISKYYRKMKRSIRRSKFYTNHTKDKKNNGRLFVNQLQKRHTYLGAQRRAKRIRIKNSTGKDEFKKIKNAYDYGNFLTYARKSEYTMEDNRIRKQLKNHWKVFNKEIITDVK